MNIYDNENKVLQVESLNHMSFDDLSSLFRQGYRFEEQSRDAIKLGLDIGLNVSNVEKNDVRNIRGLATCPSTVTTGGTLTLSTSVSSGTAPYTYHWSITKPDGTIETLANQSSIQYSFAQNGSYTISIYVTDSCAGGSKTSNTDSCVITASTVVGTKYNCVSGACQGPFTIGTYNSLPECQAACTVTPTKYNCISNQCVGPSATGTYNSLAACQASGCLGGGGTGCLNCDRTKNFCISGNCIPKKYVLIAGVGLVALLVLKS